MRADGAGKSAHLLLDVLDLLAPESIPYGIVGALAVSYYGVPRFTDDADITVWLTGTGKTGRDLKDLLADSRPPRAPDAADAVPSRQRFENADHGGRRPAS